MEKESFRILVVDDDLRLRDLLKRYLGEQGFNVKTVSDAAQMDRALLREHFDLMVLDLMLPGEDGLSICRRLRGTNNTIPIVMLTAKGDDVDRIVGCREEELAGLDEPWFPSLFESREKVRSSKTLALAAETRIPCGAVGEVLRVVRKPDGILYHIHFDCLPGRTLAVPESVLVPLAELNHV